MYFIKNILDGTKENDRLLEMTVNENFSSQVNRMCGERIVYEL